MTGSPNGRRLKTPRTTVRRLPRRGAHDFETVASILDEGFVCHAGFVVGGQPYVVPTGYGRDGRTLYIHGSSASRMLRTLAKGAPVCVTVTLVDGLVLARSAFHHSINYRSVVVLGEARLVTGDEKLHALRTIAEHMTPGRWDDVRPPTAQELKATSVLKLPIEEASAKVRTGGPVEDPADLPSDLWAGVLPLALETKAPVADADTPAAIDVPAYVRKYRRGVGGGGL